MIEGIRLVGAKLCIDGASARHRIELTDEERSELVRVARAEKLPWQEVQRARIVLYAAEGLHDTEIAVRLDTTPGIVGSGEDGTPRIGLRDCAIDRALVDRVVFPPEQVAAVKAVACELPIRYGLPLSRFSRTELHRLVIELAVSEASASTIWRWLHDDALKPWQTRSWIYRRDPGLRRGRPPACWTSTRACSRASGCGPMSTSSALMRRASCKHFGREHETGAPAPGRPIRYEFEYERGGTLAYLAAWDVHHANLFDRVEEKTGINPSAGWLSRSSTTEPYASARHRLLGC